VITQPVSFKVKTFKLYLDWIKKQHGGICYEKLLANFVQMKNENDQYWFCWMCQLSVFVGETKQEGYDLFITNVRQDEPFMRIASHVKYELAPPNQSYGETAQTAVIDGLCRWITALYLPTLCFNRDRSPYLERVTFFYDHHLLSSKLGASREPFDKKIKEHQSRFNIVLEHAYRILKQR
jgi:hypothetical protein